MKAKSPPDSILLISDLHLDPARPELTRAFCHFLDTSASQAGALYILGDFFNVWIGDDDDAPLCGEVSRALRQLAQSGTAIYLMHGNRDFLMGETWAAACGGTLIHEPYLLEQNGAQFLLAHGDALCTRDTDYMAFRAMVRDPEWQRAFLARPLDERRAFAAQARARSKTMSSNKPDDIMDVTPSEVERMLADNNATTLIHGHTHRPFVHKLAGHRTRIVLGDWDALGWYVRIENGSPALLRFDISSTGGHRAW
jgi:UDP-2,3-diacylglucosamine hydrolase